MFLPLVSDRVHPPLAVEFARLVAAANLVYPIALTVPVRCVATKLAERGKHAFFWYGKRSCELMVSCPHKRATRNNVRELGEFLAHELIHFGQWLRMPPSERLRHDLEEPDEDDEREAAAMLERIWEAYRCQTPTVGMLTKTKNRT
jgi:hypothetical protein